MTLTFTQPVEDLHGVLHHADAAAGYIDATKQAIRVLADTLSGEAAYEQILVKAAAGAGKSHALKHMVAHALQHKACRRVAVVAFANKQIFPLAEELGAALGKKQVCLLVAKDRYADVAASVKEKATVVDTTRGVPKTARVIVATSHRVGGFAAKKLGDHLGPARNGERIFDVLFIDEAWQLPLHRYRSIKHLAPISVGVGDVGQLPPLDPGQNPWRGDRTYNPYRAWPAAYERNPQTWGTALPAVWRPTAEQLALWRSFYGDWKSLHCVAAPGDRKITIKELRGDAAHVWEQVASGRPTLIEVAGLPEPEAPDIDLPLLRVVEDWLNQLFSKGFSLRRRTYDSTGKPKDWLNATPSKPGTDPLVVVLATRNQAVDDAIDMVDRLRTRHRLKERVITASTVDSWQGQTNGITIAFHPLSGASQLDEFNSAFGRLAVTCTRATHGMLMVSRAGLTDLLKEAPARPGTPIGEPGTRQLPRQTHQRILDVFARATLSVG